MHSHARGFIGILSLLITTALIVFLYWHTGIFSGSTPGTQPSLIEQNLHALDAAKEVKKQMDQRTQETTQQMQY